jgi:hypothetical protein
MPICYASSGKRCQPPFKSQKRLRDAVIKQSGLLQGEPPSYCADNFALTKERAIILASLEYEVITTFSEYLANRRPVCALRRLGETAEIVLRNPIEPEAYISLIEDFRFAIIETLSRRLSGEEDVGFDGRYVTASFRFPIASPGDGASGMMYSSKN